MASVTVEELDWAEQPLGEIEFPKERLNLAAGFGSGLATRPGAPSAGVWAIADRGPNLKIKDACGRYGWTAPDEWREVEGAKLMPRPDLGPALARLVVEGKSVRVERTIRLRDGGGRPVSGLPIPESGHAECEPVLGLDGRHLQPDPSGMDTEGLALLEDGSFWAGEEYGPSLVRISSDGEILMRLVPQGVELPKADYPVRPSLPALAAKRHLNRGFEAVAASPSNERLYLVFQSPLAHPTHEEHLQARHVRLWELDAAGGVLAQYLYPLDDPQSFRRDNAERRIERSDLKVCEILATTERELLVLERATDTCKIYRVEVAPDLALPAEHLEVETRPTVEQLSCAGADLPALSKELLFTSDDWPQVGADIEGMALLDSSTLLLASDNDFGCEGKQTRFYRLTFAEELLRG